MGKLRILDGTWKKPNLPILINIFGGPGIGKTTTAARIFVQLKMLGIEASNPEEHAKLAILKGRSDLLDQQLIILGKTWETLYILSDKVEVIVMDSPLLLCSVYGEGREAPYFHKTVVDFHKRIPRINLMLTRAEGRTYSTVGRREDEEHAKLLDIRIRDALLKNNEAATDLPSGDGIESEVLDALAADVAKAAAYGLNKRKDL